MTDAELADMVERHIAMYPAPAPVIGLLAEQWQQIIAALRRSQPEGGMVLVPRAVGVSRMGDSEKAILVHFARRLADDELRNLHEGLAGRAMLTTAEAEDRKP